MTVNSVTVGKEYVFRPVLLDLMDPKAPGMRPGMRVRVVQPSGCPPAGTMGHCHISHNEKFVGLVHCNSLQEIN